MKTQNLKFAVMLIAASLMLGTVSSCKKKGCMDETADNYNSNAEKDDGSCTYADEPTSANTIEMFGELSGDQTWTADNIYKLNGKVVVPAGVTLTIMPGTIIMGAQGTGTLASALVIAQGATINACGTASEPIIFTSELDNIQIGETTGTNLDENDQGKWGGLLILGNAPISAADGDVLSQIEGIPAGDSFGAFGGNDPADNSGTLCYVSIRHGGALIGAGNEINGLTLGGVGNGTTINNIEVIGNLDDGIEFFGGTVNITNALVGFQGDDGIDIDMNYSGTVENFMVINGANSDEGLEVDGPEGSTYTTGMFTLLNGTVTSESGTPGNGDFKSKAQGYITNVDFGIAKIRASYQNACVDPKTDAFTHLTNGTPTLVFSNCMFSAVDVYTNSDDGAATPTTCTVPTVDQNSAEGAMSSGATSGCDQSAFNNWTWCAKNAKL